MQVDRAKSLAKQYGKRLVDGVGYELNLYENSGEYIDTLHQKQVLELDEEDYKEYYLKD